ncbi:MAG: lipid-A-disaccharide synthase [Gammaproteobacteria bacterium]|nr:lipid-A-disaccharide synthase [Gammaproteobacteria bacterium]
MNVPESEKLKIAVVAGESSGDLLGADLLQAFNEKFTNCEFIGIAGPSMQEQGCTSFFPIDELSIIGIWAILKRLPRLLKLRKQLTQKIIDWNADLFIGIDAPEFNLDLELKLKQAGIKTVHYVSPSVWAWREKRIIKIKSAVDYMLTLFPFEKNIYQQHQIPVSCVGHPLAEMLVLKPETQKFREELGLDIDNKVLAMLPGSRGSEIKFLGPLFIDAAVRLKAEFPNLQIVVPLVNKKRYEQFYKLVSEKNAEALLTLVDGKSRDVMASSDAVLLASGTATLEAMLLKKPMVVAYKVSTLSYAIYSRLLKINHFALPNLLAKNPLVPEFIQKNATVEAITKEITQKLKSGLAEEHEVEYLTIHKSLQLGGGQKAVSDLAEFFEL